MKCIYANEKPEHFITTDSNLDVWDQIDTLWEVQEKAMKKLDGSEKVMFDKLVSAMISTTENNAFSPTTLLGALLYLGSICGGETKKEIFAAVGCKAENVSKVFKSIYESITGNTDLYTCTMASSVWINDKFPVYEKEISEYCKWFVSDFYSGEMGTEQIDKSIEKWIDRHTGNLLANGSSKITTSIEAFLYLLTAVYFKATWDSEFEKKYTKKDIFHANDNTEIKCDFMNRTENTVCYKGKSFTAVSKELPLDYRMWFVLPNEGHSLKDILTDMEVKKILVSPEDLKLSIYNVSMSIPIFDVTSKHDICEVMKNIGINRVFDKDLADFSTITNVSEVYLSEAKHNVRVTVNENGVEAAAYVELGCVYAGIPLEYPKMNFKLDRPFFFGITKGNRIPIFVGTILNPSEG